MTTLLTDVDAQRQAQMHRTESRKDNSFIEIGFPDGNVFFLGA